MLLYVLMGFFLLNENFEQGNIPANWQIADHGVLGATWYAGTTGTRPFYEPPNPGNYYAVADAAIDSLSRDTLFSPSIPLNSNLTALKLSYGVGMITDTSSTDTGLVVIGFYSGGTWQWQNLNYYFGQTYSQTDSADLTTYAQGKDSLKVGFYYYADANSIGYFAVDNVIVTEDTAGAEDVGVETINSPSGYIGTTSTNVSVIIKNFSNTAVGNIPLSVDIKDTVTGISVYHKDTSIASINAQATLQVDFPNFTSGSDTQFFNVQAYTYLSTDGNTSNDTAYAFCYSYPVFGTVLQEWSPLPDTNITGVDYHNGYVYLANFYTGDVYKFNPQTGGFNLEFNIDTNLVGQRTYLWDITYDRESNTWWASMLPGGTVTKSYLVHLTSSGSFIEDSLFRESDTAGIGIPASLSDAPGSNVIYESSLELVGSYKVWKIDLSNFSNGVTKLDTFSFPGTSGMPAALSVLRDTLVLLSEQGGVYLKLGLYNRALNNPIIKTDTENLSIDGGDIVYYDYPSPDQWITAYLNLGSDTLALVSLGMKWRDVYIREKDNSKSSAGISTFILSKSRSLSIKNVFNGTSYRIYTVSGRSVATGKVLNGKLRLPANIERGIYFINVNSRIYRVAIVK